MMLERARKALTFRYFVKVVMLSAVYFVTASFGLKMDAVGKFATLIWPPTGIALATLLLYGRQLWPGITLGAIAVNLVTGAPFLAACGMGLGNTLEAVVGAYLLERLLGFHKSLDRTRDVIGFILLAALFSTALSASIGVMSLWLSDVIVPTKIAVTWRSWWIGDILGDLIIAPLLLTWFTRSSMRLTRRTIAEISLLSFSTIGACLVVFDGWFRSASFSGPHSFIAFPFIIVAALRFGQIGAATTTFIVSVLAIWGTTNGLSPFVQGPLNENFLFLNSYIAVIAATGMFLASAIAERKNREDRLSKSNALRSSIIENSLDCIVMLDHEGKIREFNPAAERTFGYKSKEVIGYEMAEKIIPPKLRQAHRKGLATYLATGHGPIFDKRIELTGMRKDGSVFPVELTIIGVKHDGPPMFFGSLRDITERKRGEQERTVQYDVMSVLAESKSLEDAARKVIQVIARDLSWDLGIFWAPNDAKVALKAMEIWQAPNVNVPEFIRVTQDMVFAPGCGLPGVIWNSRKPAWTENVIDDVNFPRCTIANKEGLRTGFGFPIISRNDFLGVMEFFSHEVRPVDDSLLMATAILGGQIGEFANRILAEDSLRKAVELRDEFLSIASHELKTPLSSLNLQLQITQRGIDLERNASPSPNILAKSFATSLRQVKSLTHLVDELLDVSRIQSGKFTLELDEADLAVVTREIVERFAEQLTQAKCAIELNLEPQIVGFWDITRLEQILVNLISNVIKYAAGKPVRIFAQNVGDRAELIVQDFGPGIPAHLQGVIFERFQRASRIKNVSGLGLGLFVVKRIVEAHSGSIRLESVVGEGSKFTIEFPKNPGPVKSRSEMNL